MSYIGGYFSGCFDFGIRAVLWFDATESQVTYVHSHFSLSIIFGRMMAFQLFPMSTSNFNQH